MSLYEWPESLVPLPSFNYTAEVGGNVVRTQMDSGRVRQRRRNTAERETADVVFQLDKTQYAFFRGIFANSLNGGVDWFEMRAPAPDGESLTTRELRFTSGVSESHLAFENWEVSASVEFKEVVSLSSDIIEVYTLTGGDVTDFELAASSLWGEVSHFSAEHSFN